jgi:hypothetical protein
MKNRGKRRGNVTRENEKESTMYRVLTKCRRHRHCFQCVSGQDAIETGRPKIKLLSLM